jgi:hypothetical protein
LFSFKNKLRYGYGATNNKVSKVWYTKEGDNKPSLVMQQEAWTLQGYDREATQAKNQEVQQAWEVKQAAKIRRRSANG